MCVCVCVCARAHPKNVLGSVSVLGASYYCGWFSISVGCILMCLVHYQFSTRLRNGLGLLLVLSLSSKVVCFFGFTISVFCVLKMCLVHYQYYAGLKNAIGSLSMLCES